MNALILLSSLLLTFFCALSGHAASFYVNEVSSSNGDQQLAQTVRTLVSTSVSTAGGTLEVNESQADFTLRAEVMPLGGAFVLSVTRLKAGKPQFSSRQKALSIQELDVAADRAVRAAMLGLPTKADTRVGEVTEHQAREMQTRIQSKNSVYFGFGPGNFNNMGVSLLAYDFALGYIWGVAPQWDVKTIADFVVSNDWKTSILNGVLGLDYYFTDADSSPYLTAGFGFGASASTASSATTIGGFSGDFGLGFQLFRTSSTQFDLSLTYGSLFGNNTIGTPGFYSFRIGVLF